jgi:uncharacterized membrane protein YkvA (DUF1232 family)
MNPLVPRRLLESLATALARHPRVLIIAAFAYLITPIDLFPELLLGPAGLLDDIIVLLLPYLIREYGKKITARRNPPKYYDTTAE